MLNPKTGKFCTVCFDPPSQSIGRGRLSREGALDVRESRERIDKIFAKKTENAKILDQKQQRFYIVENFHFLAAEKLTLLGRGVISSKLASQ